MNLWTDEVGTFLEVIDGEGCATFATVKYLDTKRDYCIVEIGEGQACDDVGSYMKRGFYKVDMQTFELVWEATPKEIDDLIDRIRHQR